MVKIDNIDRSIIHALQVDGCLSQRALADEVGLSQNACARRLQRLEQAGVITGRTARVDPAMVGLALTVFVLVKTRFHDLEWARQFHRKVESIPEIVDLHRIGGEWDYMLKVVTTDMAGYDRVYRRLIDGMSFEVVSGLFSMETLFDTRPIRVA
ncbi:MAG: Lrp/AsnC family transcriptional regulator [Pseudomonadota bacterium]|nr:Lrp/AsnC family transcriptional regulator [Pseudomonadota bacterium]